MASINIQKSALTKQLMNWKEFSFIDLFACVGGIRLGFEAAGGHCVL